MIEVRGDQHIFAGDRRVGATNDAEDVLALEPPPAIEALDDDLLLERE
jgi:hypothetical protein